jgi:hypothetical protein
MGHRSFLVRMGDSSWGGREEWSNIRLPGKAPRESDLPQSPVLRGLQQDVDI